MLRAFRKDPTTGQWFQSGPPLTGDIRSMQNLAVNRAAKQTSHTLFTWGGYFPETRGNQVLSFICQA